MLAEVKKTETGYRALFERHYKHPVERVWAALTENEQLSKWFAELRMEELREGGCLKFDLGDGTFEEMRILELKPLSVLEYTWDKDQVRFELYTEEGGTCRLVLIETIAQVTDHTPKDLAGWDVCLDLIGAVLDDSPLPESKPMWEMRYPEYAKRLQEVTAAKE